MANQNATYEWFLRKQREKKKMKMLERRRRKDMPLTITSLMDAMTIILCFLLKSYEVNPVNITQKRGELMLPKSLSTSRMADVLPIQVGQTSILVQGEQVAPVKNGKVPESMKRDGADGFFITPLYDKLKAKAKELKTKYKAMGIPFEGNALIVGDQDIPYRLLSEVLYTANQAEFKLYSLAIVKLRE